MSPKQYNEQGNKLVDSVVSWGNEQYSLTGRSIHEEHRDPAYPLLSKVVARRMAWLGKVLRGSSNSLVRTAVLELVDRCLSGQQPIAGTLLADAPKFDSLEELIELAHERQAALR